MADFVLYEGRPAVRSVEDDPGQKSVPRATLGDRAGGIQHVDRRVLITPYVPERDPADPALPNSLKIERSAAPAEDLDVIAPGADQDNRPLDDEDLVLIDAGADEDLIFRPGILQRGAGSRVCRGIRG